MNENWEWLGYGPGKSPLRFSERGPESPRKRSSSFRASKTEGDGGIRTFPALDESQVSREKSTVESVDTEKSSCPESFVEESGSFVEESGGSYANGMNDSAFIEVDDEEETEFQDYTETEASAGPTVIKAISPIRPNTIRGLSFEDDEPKATAAVKRTGAKKQQSAPPSPGDAVIKPKKLPPSALEEDSNNSEKCIKWEKPEWATKKSLKPVSKGTGLK